MTQARAVCRVGDREILTVNAALGHRPFDRSGHSSRSPPTSRRPRPAHCASTNRLGARFEERLAVGRPWEELDGTTTDGRTVLWARLRDVGADLDSAGLAILGDYVPFGVGQALGIRGGGNSLDNTLRIVELASSDWVLLDISVHAVARGFGHGLAHMFARDGTLLATASQS
ncbi:MAG: thioesterase family protein [Acidimicrobiia bacterium]|nr:thioesterase family protein [Acidimicrobiia bacterium]